MLEPGETIHAKLDAYELGELLVTGRFGATFAAQRSSDDHDVIIKTIARQGTPSFTQREDFDRVVDRLRRLEHASLAGYLDGALLSHEDAMVLVQERAHGRSLKDLVSDRGAMSHDRALAWFTEALEALVHLHGQRPPLVHGDIDWGNIFVADDGSVQLVDFATARQELLTTRELSAGMVTGALDFAPMEQLLGRVYPASDMYALAMTFLAVTTATSPRDFPIDGMRPDVDALLGYGVAAALLQLLKHMTEPDPRHRLDNAQIALERVRALRFGGTSTASSPAPAAQVESAPTPDGPHPGREALLVELAKRSTTWLDALERDGAWPAPPSRPIGRIYAMGTNIDATHMLIAHAHEAIFLDADGMGVRGRVEFDELARRAAISRDGKRVALLTGFEDLLCFDAQFSIWQRHHIEVEGMWPGNSQLLFSPSGDQIVISDDDQVNIYDWETAELIVRHDVDGQYGLQFDPTGDTLYAVGADHITAFHQDGEVEVIEGDGIAFSPDGSLMAMTLGGAVRFGAFDPRAPTRDWNHDTVKLEGVTGRMNLLSFSPNQRTLVIAGQEGLMRMVDVERKAVRPWSDPRADARDKVKIFAVGYSPDSRHVLVHANLEPDDFGSGKLGAILSFHTDGGHLLGSMVWGDDELTIQGQSGFFGDVDQIDMGGFSTETWRRPRVAYEEFRGQDPLGMLDPGERAALKEFHARRETLEAACALDAGRWELGPVLDAAVGVSHILPEVFKRAEATHAEQRRLGAAFASISLTQNLVDEARALAGQGEEVLDAIHHGLVGEGHRRLQNVPERDGSYYDDDSFEGSSYDSDQEGSLYDDDFEGSRYDSDQEGSRYDDDSFEGSMYDDDRPSALSAPLTGSRRVAPARSMELRAPRATALAAPAPRPSPLIPFLGSAFLGFLPVFVTLWLLGVQTLTNTEFYLILGVPGPLITAVLYFVVLRPR